MRARISLADPLGRNAQLFVLMAVFISARATAAFFGLVGQPHDVLKAAFLAPAAVLLAIAAWLTRLRHRPEFILTAYVLAGTLVVARSFLSGQPFLGAVTATGWLLFALMNARLVQSPDLEDRR